jgi:hypothetical protein
MAAKTFVAGPAAVAADQPGTNALQPGGWPEETVDGVTGPGLPSKQAALATALLMARYARLAWRAGSRPSH